MAWCININEKTTQFMAAATALAEKIQAAHADGTLTDTKFAQAVQDLTASVSALLLAATDEMKSSPMSGTVKACDAVDVYIVRLNQLGKDFATLTGTTSPTAVYLDQYTQSPWGTLLAIAITGVGLWWLYKWTTEKEVYPLHLVPRYAGGRRR